MICQEMSGTHRALSSASYRDAGLSSGQTTASWLVSVTARRCRAPIVLVKDASRVTPIGLVPVKPSSPPDDEPVSVTP